MVSRGFSSNVVTQLSGITYRQLDYWVRLGLVRSSIRQAVGRGSRRVYSFEDVVTFRVVGTLLGAGASLQAIRPAVQYLKRHTGAVSTLALITDGKRIRVLTEDPQKMIEAMAEGQVVIAIDVAPIVRTLERRVTAIGAPREVAVRVRGRTYRAIFTPDLEAGGYTVEVPELPGCRTEGDDHAEAKRMTKDAIDAWLSVDAPGKPQRQARAR